MKIRFNPFSSNLDLTGEGSSGGGLSAEQVVELTKLVDADKARTDEGALGNPLYAYDESADTWVNLGFRQLYDENGVAIYNEELDLSNYQIGAGGGTVVSSGVGNVDGGRPDEVYLVGTNNIDGGNAAGD